MTDYKNSYPPYTQQPYSAIDCHCHLDKTYHYKELDITKAIGIILMVIGHSGCPDYLTAIIYSFHMPLFFIISGICLKETINIKQMIIKKWKRLIMPFYILMGLFLLLRPIFFYFHLYTNYTNVTNIITIKDFIINIIRIIFFIPNEPLLGATWFLPALFFSLILTVFVINSCIFNIVKNKFIFISIGLGLTIIVYYIIGEILPMRGTILRCIPFASLFILLGYFSKDLFKHINFKITIISIIITLLGYFIKGDITHLPYYKVIPFFICGISGTFTCIAFSRILLKYFEETKLIHILTHIGNNTMTILIWHFLSFKLGSLIICYFNKLDIDHIGEHPIISDLGNAWWLLYVLIGLFVPLLIGYTGKILKYNWSKRNNLTSVSQ